MSHIKLPDRIFIKSQIKPGRDLDRLVAEKVMGEDITLRTVTLAHTIPNFGEVYVPYTPLPYSTDIAAAWLIVEKWGDCWFEIEHRPGRCSTSWVWNVRKIKYTDSGNYIPYAEGDTVPHAICLAALKAVGYGEDK